MAIRPGSTPSEVNQAIAGTFPALLGIEYVDVRPGHVVSRRDARAGLLAPTNGLLHGGALITLADSACGIGAAVSLPEGARGHSTVELKANFPGLCVKAASSAKLTSSTAVARRRCGT